MLFVTRAWCPPRPPSWCSCSCGTGSRRQPRGGGGRGKGLASLEVDYRDLAGWKDASRTKRTAGSGTETDGAAVRSGPENPSIAQHELGVGIPAFLRVGWRLDVLSRPHVLW